MWLQWAGVTHCFLISTINLGFAWGPHNNNNIPFRFWKKLVDYGGCLIWMFKSSSANPRYPQSMAIIGFMRSQQQESNDSFLPEKHWLCQSRPAVRRPSISLGFPCAKGHLHGVSLPRCSGWVERCGRCGRSVPSQTPRRSCRLHRTGRPSLLVAWHVGPKWFLQPWRN